MPIFAEQVNNALYELMSAKNTLPGSAKGQCYVLNPEVTYKEEEEEAWLIQQGCK